MVTEKAASFPLILTGDFNDVPEDNVLLTALESVAGRAAVVEEDGEVGVDEVPHRHYHLLDP